MGWEVEAGKSLNRETFSVLVLPASSSSHPCSFSTLLRLPVHDVSVVNRLKCGKSHVQLRLLSAS